MILLNSGWLIQIFGCGLVIDVVWDVWCDFVYVVVLGLMMQGLVYQYQCYYCFGDWGGVDVYVGIVMVGGDYFYGCVVGVYCGIGQVQVGGWFEYD